MSSRGSVTKWTETTSRVFTRWVNGQLAPVGQSITDLQTGFHDGLQLIALVQAVSGKEIKRFNKDPKRNQQMLENSTIALDFLKNVERVDLINIGANGMESIARIDGSQTRIFFKQTFSMAQISSCCSV